MTDYNMYGKLKTDPHVEEASTHEAASRDIPPDHKSPTIAKVTFSFCWNVNPKREIKVAVYGPLAIDVFQNLKRGDNCELEFDRIVGASSPIKPIGINY